MKPPFKQCKNRTFAVVMAYEVEEGVEVPLHVEGVLTPYYPATGPTWDCGGQPAEGGDLEELTIRNEKGTPLPQDIQDRLYDDDDFLQAVYVALGQQYDF